MAGFFCFAVLNFVHRFDEDGSFKKFQGLTANAAL
jgi:hypothetical protein